jgi:hypothetical protein
MGIRVSQDYDPQTDFARYRTFDWAPHEMPTQSESLLDSPLIWERYQKAIETSLIQKGFAKSGSGQADFIVHLNWSVRKIVEVETLPDDDWEDGRRIRAFRRFETTVREYPEGTLTIDFTDAKSGGLIWRGVGVRQVTRYSEPEKSVETIEKSVAEILKAYPPKTGGQPVSGRGCSAAPAGLT